MKKNISYLAVLVLVISSFVACKKDDTTTAAATVTSSFAIRGTTFNTSTGSGVSAFQAINSFGTLVTYGLTSDGKGKGLVYISFYGTARPAAGQYNITATNPTAANQVTLLVQDSVSVAKQGLFNPTGTDNVKATVALTSAGKLSITLPSTQLTGSNFDNTNSSNTVITTTTATVSGTFTEQ